MRIAPFVAEPEKAAHTTEPNWTAVKESLAWEHEGVRYASDGMLQDVADQLKRTWRGDKYHGIIGFSGRLSTSIHVGYVNYEHHVSFTQNEPVASVYKALVHQEVIATFEALKDFKNWDAYDTGHDSPARVMQDFVSYTLPHYEALGFDREEVVPGWWVQDLAATIHSAAAEQRTLVGLRSALKSIGVELPPLAVTDGDSPLSYAITSAIGYKDTNPNLIGAFAVAMAEAGKAAGLAELGRAADHIRRGTEPTESRFVRSQEKPAPATVQEVVAAATARATELRAQGVADRDAAHGAETRSTRLGDGESYGDALKRHEYSVLAEAAVRSEGNVQEMSYHLRMPLTKLRAALREHELLKPRERRVPLERIAR